MTNHMTEQESKDQLYRVIDAVGDNGEGMGVYRFHALRKAARYLDQISVRECNGVQGPDGHMKWDDQDQRRADKARTRWEERALDALRDVFGADLPQIDVEFQGDPRGPSIIIHTKGKQDRLAAFW